jgi:poly(hydroxyalkanoate) depolymerase family esterase
MKLGTAIAIVGAAMLWQGLPTDAAAQSLTEVTGFGTNPGQLRAFKHIPQELPPNSPLVVALHGCLQSASGYDDETGWVKYADMGKFALLLPQQELPNNLAKCFNWFELGDIQRDQGEALSIKHMIDKMVTDHNIDRKRIYITGLSAGAGMTVVMLATYPELFAGGATSAGLPYKCATNVTEARNSCMRSGKNQSPAQWGDLVRAASSHGSE